VSVGRDQEQRPPQHQCVLSYTNSRASSCSRNRILRRSLMPWADCFDNGRMQAAAAVDLFTVRGTYADIHCQMMPRSYVNDCVWMNVWTRVNRLMFSSPFIHQSYKLRNRVQRTKVCCRVFPSHVGARCWSQFLYQVSQSIQNRAGFTPSGAPVQKKMWGPLLYEYPPTAFSRHAQ